MKIYYIFNLKCVYNIEIKLYTTKRDEKNSI